MLSAINKIAEHRLKENVVAHNNFQKVKYVGIAASCLQSANDKLTQPGMRVKSVGAEHANQIAYHLLPFFLPISPNIYFSMFLMNILF